MLSDLGYTEDKYTVVNDGHFVPRRRRRDTFSAKEPIRNSLFPAATESQGIISSPRHHSTEWSARVQPTAAQCISVVTPALSVLLLNAHLGLRRPQKKAVYHYRDQMQCTLPIKNMVYIYKYFGDLKTLKSSNSLQTFIPDKKSYFPPCLWYLLPGNSI